MSYAKMMKWSKTHRKGIRNLHLDFGIIGENERRETPWLGSAWYGEGKEAEREEYIRQWKEETTRMLKVNPNLKII